MTSLGAMIFKERCCRLSYGVLCSEEYDPENNPSHIRQKVSKNPHDGKLWVEGQIDWFLKQVCKIPEHEKVVMSNGRYFKGRHGL